jgi:hypothetical protein
VPRKFAVQQIRRSDSHHVQLHVLWLPFVTETGFYRQVTSFNAFFHSGKLKKHGPNWSPEFLYRELDWEEFEIECNTWREHAGKYDLDPDACDWRKLPTTEHQSIWEFYEAIGYDYKSKRWWENCQDCSGYGYTESPAFYFGRMECSACDGSGYVLGNSRKHQQRGSLQ